MCAAEEHHLARTGALLSLRIRRQEGRSRCRAGEGRWERERGKGRRKKGRVMLCASVSAENKPSWGVEGGRVVVAQAVFVKNTLLTKREFKERLDMRTHRTWGTSQTSRDLQGSFTDLQGGYQNILI